MSISLRTIFEGNFNALAQLRQPGGQQSNKTDPSKKSDRALDFSQFAKKLLTTLSVGTSNKSRQDVLLLEIELQNYTAHEIQFYTISEKSAGGLLPSLEC